MTDWIFTFGVNHPFKDKFVTINAISYDDARNIMIQFFNLKWSHQYDANETATKQMIETHNLTELAYLIGDEI